MSVSGERKEMLPCMHLETSFLTLRKRKGQFRSLYAPSSDIVVCAQGHVGPISPAASDTRAIRNSLSKSC